MYGYVWVGGGLVSGAEGTVEMTGAGIHDEGAGGTDGGRERA